MGIFQKTGDLNTRGQRNKRESKNMYTCTAGCVTDGIMQLSRMFYWNFTALPVYLEYDDNLLSMLSTLHCGCNVLGSRC